VQEIEDRVHRGLLHPEAVLDPEEAEVHEQDLLVRHQRLAGLPGRRCFRLRGNNCHLAPPITFQSAQPDDQPAPGRNGRPDGPESTLVERSITRLPG
jgi:hypothetical protein